MSTDTQLREALSDLAGQLDRTEDPWTEHERRMAARTRSRRGWTVAAAAACVLLAAAVVTPFVFANLQAGPPDVAGQPPAQTRPEQPGEVRVASYLNGGYRKLWVSVERQNGRDTVCKRETVRQTPVGKDVDEPGGGCRPMTPHDGPAAITALRLPFCDTGDPNAITDCAQSTGAVVLAVAPKVASVQVTTADGRVAAARELVHAESARVFVARFPDTEDADQPRQLDRQRLHVAARDADGQLVQKVVLPAP